MTQIVGLLGLLLIASAWAVNIARKSPPPPLDLTLLYLLGSVILTVYALILGDIIFTVLNAVSSMLSLINLLRALRIKNQG